MAGFLRILCSIFFNLADMDVLPPSGILCNAIQDKFHKGFTQPGIYLPLMNTKMNAKKKKKKNHYIPIVPSQPTNKEIQYT